MPMQSVDEAAAMIEQMLDAMMTSEDSYNVATLKKSFCFLTHCERDGVVWRGGWRSVSDRPKRARRAMVRFRLKVAPHMANPFGTMHGGCTATIADTLSSFALLLHCSGEPHEPWTTMGMSQTLSVQYAAPLSIGTWIEVEARTMSVGRAAALLHIDFFALDSRDGKRVTHAATATHTKIDVSKPHAKL